MVTIVWGTHALPLYWDLLNHEGNSSLLTQKRLLKIALKVLNPYPVLVIGDREFHSPKLAQWLDERGVAFALRQKKDLHFQVADDGVATLSGSRTSRDVCIKYHNKKETLQVEP